VAVSGRAAADRPRHQTTDRRPRPGPPAGSSQRHRHRHAARLSGCGRSRGRALGSAVFWSRISQGARATRLFGGPTYDAEDEELRGFRAATLRLRQLFRLRQVLGSTVPSTSRIGRADHERRTQSSGEVRKREVARTVRHEDAEDQMPARVCGRRSNRPCPRRHHAPDLLTELLFQRRPPRYELEAGAVVSFAPNLTIPTATKRSRKPPLGKFRAKSKKPLGASTGGDWFAALRRSDLA
jgi:hypothetical protein